MAMLLRRCVFELFIFKKMGGRMENVHIFLLGEGDARTSTSFAKSFADFDAYHAEATDPKDKQKLLNIIDRHFGIKEFNKQVKGCLLYTSPSPRDS